VELPQRDIVFGVVVPDSEPVAVWLDVDENPDARSESPMMVLTLTVIVPFENCFDNLQDRHRLVSRTLWRRWPQG
jgi:hypothetical protein